MNQKTLGPLLSQSQLFVETAAANLELDHEKFQGRFKYLVQEIQEKHYQKNDVDNVALRGGHQVCLSPN